MFLRKKKGDIQKKCFILKEKVNLYKHKLLLVYSNKEHSYLFCYRFANRSKKLVMDKLWIEKDHKVLSGHNVEKKVIKSFEQIKNTLLVKGTINAPKCIELV